MSDLSVIINYFKFQSELGVLYSILARLSGTVSREFLQNKTFWQEKEKNDSVPYKINRFFL